jgi:putative addiction module killer protein
MSGVHPRIDTDPSQQRSAPLFRAGHADRSAS